MTGIERLSEVVRELGRFSFCYDLYETLGNIADQIEREQDAMVADSPYDALPPDERDAIAWVREHGGVEKIIKQRRDSVPRAAFERKLGKRLRHIAECEEALRRRNATISALEKTADLLRKQIADMRPRLMPEGMEWMVEAWPRFEDDAPVRFLDDFERYGDENGVSAVTMYSDGSFALNCRAYSKGERVKRPATKVLDADGAEIRVGDELWHVSGYGPRTVGKVNADGSFCFGRCERAYKAEEFTHRAPVLAADGKPLREGETVWDVDGGGPYEVEGFVGKPLCVMLKSGINHEMPRDPSELAHERPESWERLEEDATISPETYCVKRGIDFSDVDGQHRVLDEVTERMARDLVRRAKELAERDR